MNSSTFLSHTCSGLRTAVLLSLLCFVTGAGADNIALLGTGILGINPAVDSQPGIPLFHAGSGRSINDGDPATTVDNFSGGADQGWGYSHAGVVWPGIRPERIETLTLTMATFPDGGWFGPNGSSPGPGGTLTAEHLREPQVQVTTNGGSSWFNIPFTSDYLIALNGMSIAGGGNPTPMPLVVTFTLVPAVSNINGIRVIGENAGNAGPDANGFLGVAELAVDAVYGDSDGDGMPDEWERAFNLAVGVNDSGADADSDGLLNAGEYQAATDPRDSDTDNDGYSDGVEVSSGSNPKDVTSIPGNLAKNGTPVLGTRSGAGVDTEVVNAGLLSHINDGDPTTRADTWNGGGTDKLSFVGILWNQATADPVLRLELTLATFYDGGWFGPNNRGPGAGRKLTPTYLSEPKIEVTPDGGATWTNATFVSDYLTRLNGHGIGGGTNPNPSTVTASFILEPAVSNITGIRLIGSEGGTASGGFLGVVELKVYARTDVDKDRMDDDWERKNSLVVGVNDAESDPDDDQFTSLQEYLNGTNPQKADTDEDGLKDGVEVVTYHTNPGSSDTDQDGLSDGAELLVYSSNPLLNDTDGDRFYDGLEVELGSDLLKASSIPSNLSLRSDATGILGTTDFEGGTDTLMSNAGSPDLVNDGDLDTRVDTFNPAGSATMSFVGIVWTNAVTNTLAELELQLATFFDGGWFGVNNSGPGAGGTLSTNTDLLAPKVQVSRDGGTTWQDVTFVTDYMTALEGHALPAQAYGAPTRATAHFQLAPPQTGVNAVRIIGSEGGIASGGFLGVFELLARTSVQAELRLGATTVQNGLFSFELSTRAGSTYAVQYKSSLSDPTWQALTNFVGDGSVRIISDPTSGLRRFYRVAVQ